MPTFATRHGELFYEDLNAEAPGTPVVLLHNFMSTGRVAWGKVALELATSYRVILPDLPGHGRSRGFPPGFDHRAMAADVAALLAGLDIPRAHIGGASAGATLAQWMVQDGPQYERPLTPVTLTLVSSTYSINPATTGTAIDLRVESFNLGPNWLEVTARLQDAQQGEGYFFETMLPAFRALTPDQVIDLPRTALAAWTLPVCIIHGEDDEIFSAEIAEQMHATLPNSELHLIPQQGHALILRDSRRVLGIMQDFLARHDAPDRTNQP